MSKTISTTAISSLMIALLIIIIVGVIAFNYTATFDKNIYAHSEGVTLSTNKWKLLKTTSPDGTAENITLESASSGYVALGNSSVINLNALAVGYGDIKKLPASTWTFKYRAVANVTNKVSLCVNITIVFPNGTERSSLAGFTAESTSNLTTSFSTVSGTYSHTEYTVLSTADYLKIQWYAHKYDTTALKINLLLDDSSNPTEIDGINIEAIGLSGTNLVLAKAGWLLMFLAIVITTIYSVTRKKA